MTLARKPLLELFLQIYHSNLRTYSTLPFLLTWHASARHDAYHIGTSAQNSVGAPAYCFFHLDPGPPSTTYLWDPHVRIVFNLKQLMLAACRFGRGPISRVRARPRAGRRPFSWPVQPPLRVTGVRPGSAAAPSRGQRLQLRALSPPAAPYCGRRPTRAGCHPCPWLARAPVSAAAHPIAAHHPILVADVPLGRELAGAPRATGGKTPRPRTAAMAYRGRHTPGRGRTAAMVGAGVREEIEGGEEEDSRVI
jgi:hypothetical protein